MSKFSTEPLTKAELALYEMAPYSGTAKRVETKEEPAPEAPTVTFDWSSGGRVSGRSRTLSLRTKNILGGVLFFSFLGLVAAGFAFGIVAIAVWGEVDTYAGLEKKNVKNVTASLLTKYGHDDWRALEPTHSSIFSHDAWSVQVKLPGTGPRCIYVWEGDEHSKMSRLSRCKAIAS